MNIPSEVFIKLDANIFGWENNYELVSEGKLLFLKYVGADDQNTFLDFPEEPNEYEFDDEEDSVGYEEFLAAVEYWEKEVKDILKDYCHSLSGENYKVGILGYASNPEGFVYTFF